MGILEIVNERILSVSVVMKLWLWAEVPDVKVLVSKLGMGLEPTTLSLRVTCSTC